MKIHFNTVTILINDMHSFGTYQVKLSLQPFNTLNLLLFLPGIGQNDFFSLHLRKAQFIKQTSFVNMETRITWKLSVAPVRLMLLEWTTPLLRHKEGVSYPWGMSPPVIPRAGIDFEPANRSHPWRSP